jgi:hypothetical protein
MKPSDEQVYALHYTPNGGVTGITRDLSHARAIEMLRWAMEPQPVTTGAGGGTTVQKRKRFIVEVVDNAGTVIETAEGGDTN